MYMYIYIHKWKCLCQLSLLCSSPGQSLPTRFGISALSQTCVRFSACGEFFSVNRFVLQTRSNWIEDCRKWLVVSQDSWRCMVSLLAVKGLCSSVCCTNTVAVSSSPAHTGFLSGRTWEGLAVDFCCFPLGTAAFPPNVMPASAG